MIFFFRSLRLRGILLLFGISTGCTSPPPAVPLEVDYAGCQALLLPGPVCVLYPSRTLFLWFEPPPEAQIEIRAGGERIDADIEPVREGQKFSVKIPAGAERVDVLVKAAGRRATWFLDLASQAQPKTSYDVIHEVDEAAKRAYDLIQDRNFLEVRGILSRLQLPSKAPAESLYLVAYYRAFLAESQGDYRSALAAIQEAVEVAERVLWVKRKQWLAEEKMALLLRDLGRSQEAAELFERLARTPYFADSCEEAQFLNNQAWSELLAREAGESFADPAPLFEKALETYRGCDGFTGDKKFNLLINLSLAHLKEERVQQAKGFLTQAHELAPHARLYQKLWWFDLEARIALQDGRPEKALREFQRLEELALATSSPDGRLRAAFGQARSHDALRDLTAALEALQKAEALLDEQSLQIPLYVGRETFMAMRQAVVNMHVETLLRQGRNADALAVVRRGRARMLRQLERSDRLASLTSDQRVQWDRLLTEYQKKRSALEERAKDDWKLPLDQFSREQAAKKAEAEAVQRILDQAFMLLGDPEEQPGSMPPPRPGELILAYYPLSRHWVGFAADGESVAVRRFDVPDTLPGPVELANQLLWPFRAQIERAKRIRVLASGRLQSVDFATLPFQGDVLLARCPIAYGLDLPVPPGQPRGRRALLVADPSGDLPGTLKEARMVRNALQHQARPWTIEELKAAQASLQAVRTRLAASDLLHYAGHGIFSGPGGWESSLHLAEETRLTLGDLLALDRVPAWVVLSGCETGRSSAEIPVESLGLAHAFLLAGSRAVIASTRRADDLAMPKFFPEMYRQWDGEQDLAVALQRAQLSWRQQNPQVDWANFRLFEP